MRIADDRWRPSERAHPVAGDGPPGALAGEVLTRRSCALSQLLAEQAGRPEHEHDDEDAEHDRGAPPAE